eukprot:SAG25_NODE_648_length_6205_cov_2.314609_1_plen_168_part_00
MIGESRDDVCGGWHSITRQGAGRQKAGSSQSAASLASSLASSFASLASQAQQQQQQQQQHTVRVKNHWRSIFVTSLKGWEKSPPSSSSNVAFTPPEFCGDPMGRWCSGGVLPRGRLVGDCARPRPESRQRCRRLLGGTNLIPGSARVFGCTRYVCMCTKNPENSGSG